MNLKSCESVWNSYVFEFMRSSECQQSDSVLLCSETEFDPNKKIPLPVPNDGRHNVVNGVFTASKAKQIVNEVYHKFHAVPHDLVDTWYNGQQLRGTIFECRIPLSDFYAEKVSDNLSSFLYGTPSIVQSEHSSRHKNLCSYGYANPFSRKFEQLNYLDKNAFYLFRLMVLDSEKYKMSA